MLLGEVKTYLIISLRRDGAAGLQTGGNVQSLANGLDAADDAERQESGGETRAVAEEANSLVLESLAVGKGQQAGQSTPDTGAVHVTAKSGHLDGGVDALLVALLGEGHESLLESLVGQGLLVVHVTQLRGDLSKSSSISVAQEVVVQQSGVRLLDQLAGGGVEGKVVEAVQGGLGLVDTVGGAVSQLGLLFAVVTVGGVEGLCVAGQGEVAVDDRVLAGQVGLVEVVGVLHVAATQTRLDNNRSVRANENGDGTSATGGAGSTLCVEGNVAGDNNGIAAVPGGGLDPVDAVEEGVGAAVAGVDGVDTLNVGVVAKQLHQDRLDRLGLVEDGLSANLEAADRVDVDVVVLEQF